MALIMHFFTLPGNNLIRFHPDGTVLATTNLAPDRFLGHFLGFPLGILQFSATWADSTDNYS